LQHTGIPVGFAEFEERWNDPQEGELLKKIVDSFDKHGLIVKTNTVATNDEVEDDKEVDISQIAKSSVRKKGDSKLRQISKASVRSK
jgi:hypothetical protein